MGSALVIFFALIYFCQEIWVPLWRLTGKTLKWFISLGLDLDCFLFFVKRLIERFFFIFVIFRMEVLLVFILSEWLGCFFF